MANSHRKDETRTSQILHRCSARPALWHHISVLSKNSRRRRIDRVPLLFGRNTTARYRVLQSLFCNPRFQHHLTHGRAANISGAHYKNLRILGELRTNGGSGTFGLIKRLQC